jgi:hypothetical protein
VFFSFILLQPLPLCFAILELRISGFLQRVRLSGQVALTAALGSLPAVGE